MAKSIAKIKQGLKLKAEPKAGALTLRLGTKKLVLPFEPRLITSGEFVFVHLTPNAEIFKITDEGLVMVESTDDADRAAAAFRKPRGPRGGRKAAASTVELPDELKDIESKLPSGFRIGYDKDGKLKLVKTRKRRK